MAVQSVAMVTAPEPSGEDEFIVGTGALGVQQDSEANCGIDF